jgi:hypothetical protein
MASAQLSRRVGKVVGYAPLGEMGPEQRREFHEALLEAETLEDLPVSGRRPFSRRSRTGRTSASSPTTDRRSGRGSLWLSATALPRPSKDLSSQPLNGVLDQ